MNRQLNIVIAGKSGVGKSSFLNYLIGSDKFETGNGDPVTQNYFQLAHYISPNGVPYELYDTKGLEPGECEKSKKIIMDEIEKRDLSDDIFRWIHSVYYCFSASSHRIEPFEIDFINTIKEKCSVVILLTKADQSSKEDIAQMQNELLKHFSDEIQIIPVCSVSQRTRKGESKQFGKEEVLNASFLGLWSKLATILPYRLTSKFNEKLPANYNGIVSLFLNHPKLAEYLGIYNKHPQTHIEALCDISNMSLYLSDQDSSDRSSLRGVMEDLDKSLFSLKCSFSNISVDTMWKPMEDIIQQVFDFYADMHNSTSPKVLFLHRAKRRLADIRNFDLSVKIEKINERRQQVDKCLKDVAGCLIWDSDEKKSVLRAWNVYRDSVVELGYTLKELLFMFEATFEAELYQYGQYCIREF